MKDGGHDGEPFSKICDVSSASKKHNLKKHEKTEKHQFFRGFGLFVAF